ncbi:MAG: ComF family protein [Saprospiraceae bacterium]|nr:ComF family protein [Saprospiraceae bacterium]
MTFPSVRELWGGFVHLLYPELCAACGEELPHGDVCFCFKCQLKVSTSEMHFSRENEFTNRLWGRVNIESGAAMYYFSRKGPVQQALHQLKYHNQPDIGVKIGRAFGKKLRSSEVFQSVELIIPVPLHPKKERLRGYNQSALFAQGLSEPMGIPVLHRVLIRRSFTETQTKKKRMDRFGNVGEIFVVDKPSLIAGKHLLLVDDVLTTGATLEECGKALLSVPNTKLSMATIAIAVN